VIDIGMRYNPWRSPGKAPVIDPCGVVAGNQPGEYIIGGPEPGTFGSTLPETEGPEFAAGSIQEVSWSLYANHGGGYSYRLCPKSEPLTEECMQRHPLEFADEVSWIQWKDDKSNRTQIAGRRLTVGTHPAGSEWKRNPIPACAGDVGGAANPIPIPGLDNCHKAQFDPPMVPVTTHPKWAPLPGLYGFGGGAVGPFISVEQFNFWSERFSFNIVDRVKIPSDLPPGEYVLGFRWDCEQTPQIWQNCADITITAPAESVQV
jgi:hypothetical protein